MAYIERKSELKRRRQRREKVRKLKAKIAKAKNPHEAQLIQQKMLVISPFVLTAHAPAPVKKPAPSKRGEAAKK